MSDLIVRDGLPPTGPAALASVRALTDHLLTLPQVPIETRHVLHAGMYARTIIIPAGTALTGALIKIPTVLVFDGDAIVSLDGDSVRMTGHHVLPASAGRKQAFATIAETHLTMLFPTAAKTIEQAEREFTDEADALLSRRTPLSNHFTITGE